MSEEPKNKGPEEEETEEEKIEEEKIEKLEEPSPSLTGSPQSPEAVIGGKRRRRTMKKRKKMSKRKLTKWCKSKKNRRTKAGRKMCKK